MNPTTDRDTQPTRLRAGPLEGAPQPPGHALAIGRAPGARATRQQIAAVQRLAGNRAAAHVSVSRAADDSDGGDWFGSMWDTITEGVGSFFDSFTGGGEGQGGTAQGGGTATGPAGPGGSGGGGPASGAGLQVGSRGPQVLQLQQMLRSRGQNIAADGIFGPMTQAALRSVQQSLGLPATGVGDPETMAALTGGGGAQTTGGGAGGPTGGGAGPTTTGTTTGQETGGGTQPGSGGPGGAGPGVPPAVGANAELINEAAQVLEASGGRAQFQYAPADGEAQQFFVLFTNEKVNRLFQHILEHWFGSADNHSLENTADQETPPPWVSEFRARALNVRPSTADADQQALARLAVMLADSVAPMSPGEQFRQMMVKEQDARVGTTVMTQEQIDAMRAKGMSNFTTCIEFFGQMMRTVSAQMGLDRPLMKGPTAYKEINPQAKENLPPGTWIKPDGTNRPKPGDIIITTVAETYTTSRGTTLYKGYFSHVCILRSIEPINDPANVQGAQQGDEKWVTTDGGGTTTMEYERIYSPSTNRLKLFNRESTVHGWVDVAKLADTRMNG